MVDLANMVVERLQAIQGEILEGINVERIVSPAHLLSVIDATSEAIVQLAKDVREVERGMNRINSQVEGVIREQLATLEGRD